MWTFYLLALAYTMFAFFYLQTKNKLTSLLVALAVSFSTGLIVFLYIGHVTKLTSLWVFPVLFLAALQLSETNQTVRNFSANLFYGCNVSRLACSDYILHLFCGDDLFHLFLFQIIKNKR